MTGPSPFWGTPVPGEGTPVLGGDVPQCQAGGYPSLRWGTPVLGRTRLGYPSPFLPLGQNIIQVLDMRWAVCLLGSSRRTSLLIYSSYYFRPTWNTHMITRIDDLQLEFTMNIQTRTSDSC